MRTEDAAAHYRNAIRFRPGYGDANINLGSILAREGRYLEAIGYFQAATPERPDLAHFNLGVAFKNMGRTDDAFLHFSEAARVDPDNPLIHRWLGIILARRGELDGAIRHFSRAVQLRPQDGFAHNDLGIALAMTGRRREADSAFQVASRMSHGNLDARRNLEALRAGRDIPARFHEP